MLPNPAEDLEAGEKSPMKILVTWTTPSPLRDFPPGLLYRLDLRGLDPPVPLNVWYLVHEKYRYSSLCIIFCRAD